MAQQLNFSYDKQSGRYVATTIVTDDFNLHIKFDQASVVTLYTSTAGDDFDEFKKYSVSMRPYCFDKDIDLLVYPKRIKVATTIEPVIGVVSHKTPDAAATTTAEQIASLQQQLNTLRGTDQEGNVVDTTEEIDSIRDLRNFTAGHTSNETIRDAVESNLAEEQDVNNLFNQ